MVKIIVLGDVMAMLWRLIRGERKSKRSKEKRRDLILLCCVKGLFWFGTELRGVVKRRGLLTAKL